MPLWLWLAALLLAAMVAAVVAWAVWWVQEPGEPPRHRGPRR